MREPYRSNGFVPLNTALLDGQSGGVVTIAGETPLLVHKSAVEPDIIDAIRASGLAPTCNFRRYQNRAEHLKLMAQLPAGSLVLQHACPVQEIPPRQYWFNRDRLIELNDKANLAEHVGLENSPQRRLLQIEEAVAKIKNFPVAVKASSDVSLGAAEGVRLCHTYDAFRKALCDFASCERIVVEQWLNFDISYCLSFAVTENSQIHYLGAAEQIVAPGGQHQGNWLGSSVQASSHLIDVGRRAAASAARCGYVGFIGVDVCEAEPYGGVAFDLNCRLNYSTIPLLLQARGSVPDFPVILSKGLRMPPYATQTKAWKRFKDMLGEYVFVYAGYIGEQTFVRALICGPSRTKVAEQDAALEQLIAEIWKQ